MRDSKNIDRLFQENLKDYEVFPPNKSWNSIKRNLTGAPRKKPITALWVRLSSIAALLVLFFTVGTIYFIPQNNFTKNLIPKKNNDQKSIQNNNTTEEVVASSTTQLEKVVNTGSKIIPLNTYKNPQNTIVDSDITPEQTKDKIAEKQQESASNFLLADTKNLPLKEFKPKKEVDTEIVNSKFTVATIFAPIYFNSFGDGSSVDAQFNNNNTSGNSSYAYGVKVAYKLNNKLSVQSGVNMINLGQTTNDVYVTQGIAVVSLDHISSMPSSAKNNVTPLAKNNGGLTTDNSASLNQVFGYVEIPVELKYNVSDGKIGVNLIGGFSTLLLNKDEVYVQSNSFSQSLGNSNNLRSVNFSGNVGLDVDYSIYKNLYINVSPMFKVQTNTFSKTSGTIQSYYLGVYTGLNYKF